MRGTSVLVLLAANAAEAGYHARHGWRDQHIRVSPTLQQHIRDKTARRELFEMSPEEKLKAARQAIAVAETVHHAKRFNEQQKAKPQHERRKLLEVTFNGPSITVGGVVLPDMTFWDCPWAASLHPYLNDSAPFFVDGGLCLPYQEIPFPYSIGTDPVDTSASGANIVCPANSWDPNAALCAGGADLCYYLNPGDGRGVGENYGCAAKQPGWPSTPAAELTPICQKTYVGDCTYSKGADSRGRNTRAYQWGPQASFDGGANQGYSIDWVLDKVGSLRNSLGAGPVMDADLTAAGYPTTGFQFPDVYEFLWGLPAGTDPPTSGQYPHAFVKGYFKSDMTIDTSKDGICDEMDAATQWMDCGIPCPVGDEARMSGAEMSGFGIAVILFMAICASLGAVAACVVKSDSSKFFVAGRNFNIFVVTATLASQSLDSNAALGNLELGYKYHWWDGACLPIGLGLSLILNSIFFAKPLNEMRLLTLPDLFARKFGTATEMLFSCLAIFSFLALLAGNLVGTGKILNFVFGLEGAMGGVWIATACIWAYTVAGGLVSVAYTDCLQAALGWLGLVVGSAWILNNMPNAAGISPAYPMGDKQVFGDQMFGEDALAPIPNAIFFNWVTIFVLGFGNLAALDFQARVFGSKSPKVAQLGCLIGGFISIIVGVTFSYTSGAARALYGPSSPYAEFVADSCSQDITIIGCFGGATGACEATVLPGVPTCGEWKPDPLGPLRMLTCTKPDCHYFFDFDGSGGLGALADGNFPMSPFIGGWVLLAIVAASMSTGDGAILAMSTVFAHNLLRKLPVAFLQDDKNLVTVARLATIIWAVAGGLIAGIAPDATGYFLIFAFDIMLSGSVVPMFAAVYWKSCKPLAAFAAMFTGSLVRLILEYTLTKDFLLLLVGRYARSFGPGSYGGLDPVTGLPLPDWCPQFQLQDLTGLDSIVSPFVSLAVLLIGNLVLPKTEHKWFTPVAVTNKIEGETKTAKESKAESKAAEVSTAEA